MSHPPNTWKGVEMRIGRFLGGRRTPLSGSNSGHNTSADVLEVPGLYCEIKHGSKAELGWDATEKLLADTARKAKAEGGKLPVVVLHRKGNRGVGTYPAFLYMQIPKVGTRMVCVPMATLKEILEGR